MPSWILTEFAFLNFSLKIQDGGLLPFAKTIPGTSAYLDNNKIAYTAIAYTAVQYFTMMQREDVNHTFAFWKNSDF